MYSVGDRVMANGYLGTVEKVHTGQLTGMVDVKLASGGICIDASDVHAGEVYDAMLKIAQSDMRKVRKEGSILMAQTKHGTVELSYDAVSKYYTAHTQGLSARQLFSAPAKFAVALMVAELYAIVAE